VPATFPNETYDAICIGGGLGGLAAALRLHEMGAKALVLERSSMIGGVAAYSGGWCWVGGYDSNGGDTIEAAEDYLDYIQGEGRPVDYQARRTYLELAVEATEWFVKAGVPLRIVHAAPDLYHPCPGSTHEGRLLECAVYGRELTELRPWLRPNVYYNIGLTRDETFHSLGREGNNQVALRAKRKEEDYLTHGVGLVGGFMRESLVKRAIEYRLNHHVIELTWDGQKVTGVVVEGQDGPFTIRANLGVLIATGGYGSSPDAANLEDVPELIEAAPPIVYGDGLELAGMVGGTVTRGADPFVVVGARFGNSVHPGTDSPLFTPLLESIGFPHSIIVNKEGNRFGDESYYGALIRGLRAFDDRRRRWVNYPCWLIFDETYRCRYPIGAYAAGEQYKNDIMCRDSLEDLAVEIGVDPGGLKNSVVRFNQLVSEGEDVDFGRGSLDFTRKAYGDIAYSNPNLGEINHPPFYAIQLTSLGVGLCSFGLSIDSDGRVLRRDRSPVKGLYATGNAAATRELKGYVTGLANARNYSYAYAAANHMCTIGQS